jgi:hypothetical protein
VLAHAWQFVQELRFAGRSGALLAYLQLALASNCCLKLLLLLQLIELHLVCRVAAGWLCPATCMMLLQYSRCTVAHALA